MPGLTAGTAYLAVKPDLRGLHREIRSEVAGVTANIKTEADTGAAGAALNAVAKDRTSGIKAQADTSAAAAALNAVAQDRAAGINANVDRGSATQASAALDAVARTRTAKVNVKTDSSQLAQLNGIAGQTSLTFGQMAIAAGTLGAALVPAAAAAGGLALALSAPLAAASAGIGALAISATGNIAQIIQGQQDLETAQASAASAATTLASAQDGVKSALEGVKQAQQGVVTAQRNADRAVADSVRSLAQARVEADQAVQTARTTLSSTITSANQSVRGAEDSLAAAQDRARSAQEALNDARDAARQKLADYDAQLRGAALDESGAKLAVRQAQQALNEILADPKATQLQIDLAKQALKESRYNYNQAKKDRTDLRKQADEDRRQGIKGDEDVRDAKQNVADANRDIRDAERELAQTRVQAAQDIAAARQAVVQARVDGARQIADAERQVQRARVDGAQAVAQAQAGVVSAQRQLGSAQAAAAAAAAGYATAQGDVAAAMRKLDGPAKGFVRALDDAKAAWHRFLDATAGPVLGVASQGLRIFTRLMPKFAPLVKTAAGAVGGLLREFGRATKGPEFKGFLRFLERTTGPAITSFGHILGNIAVGVGGLVRAFAPLGRDVLKGIENLTARFADFGRTANKNDGVKGFIDYVRRVGPLVVSFFAGVATAVGHLLQAFAPFGEVVLRVLTFLVDMFNKIPVDVLTALIAGVVAATIAVKAFAVAQLFLNGALALSPLTWIAIGIGVLVAALVIAYKRSETFRKVVDAAWAAVKKGAQAMWRVVKRVFEWLKPAFRAVGSVAAWLWNKAIKPAFNKIGEIARWLWNKAIKPAFAALKNYFTKVLFPLVRFMWDHVYKPVFNKIGAIAKWLWEKAIGPAFRAIGKVAKWLWENAIKPAWENIKRGAPILWNKIKPILGWFGNRLEDVGKAAKWLWDNAIKPAWGKIKDAIGWAWEHIIAPAFSGMRKGFRKLGDVFEWVWDNVLKPPLDAFKKILEEIKDAVGWVLDKAGDVKDLAGDIGGGIKGGIGKAGDWLGMASGGYVTGPTPAIVGEGGEAEAILPKSVLTGLMRAAGAAGAAVAGSAPGTDAPRGVRRMYVGNPLGDGRDVQKTWRSRIAPTLKGFSKGVRDTTNRTVGMELAVGKSAKKMGRYWTVLRRGPMQQFSKDWRKRLNDASNDAAMLDRDTGKATDRIGRGLKSFRSGPLQGFAKDWGDRFRSETPDDVSVFRDKTIGHISGTRDGIKRVWSDSIKPTMRTFGEYPKDTVAPLFGKGVDAIGNAWDNVGKKTAKPVKFVVQTVLNKGLRGGFNQVAKFVDADEMPEITLPKSFRTGGVMPGYSPGRDVHQFYSRTGGRLDLSGGEAIMRPEWTRAVGGPRAIDEMNRAATRGNGPHRTPPPHPKRRGFWMGGVFPLPGGAVTNMHDVPYYGAWYAADLNGPGDDTGMRIVSWKKGIVAEASMNGEDGSYGNVTVINHDDGNYSRYAHQSAIRVRGGQDVGPGDYIGNVGAVGNVSGPHLHFEIGGGKAQVIPGGGGLDGLTLPGWAQKIASGATEWAKGLLDGGDRLSGPFGELAQKTLNRLVEPVADWALSKLGSAGAAGSFGPGAEGVWKSLMSTGWYSKQQAAGVMGNMQSESGFDHLIVQGGSHSVHPENITGETGWGLVQWTPGSKIAPYLKGDVSIASQIDALTAQLQGKGPAAESKAGAALQATDSVRAAAISFLHDYERPADQSAPVENLRAAQAQAIFDRFAFDLGGIATGTGLLRKAIREPERMLSPRQTASFERMVARDFHPAHTGPTSLEGDIQITNWQTGEAYFRGVAAGQDAHTAAHRRAVGAM